jgi:hypothetical protein
MAFLLRKKAMAMYVVREIDLEFRLGQGGFDSTNFDTLTLRGLRVQAQISTVINSTINIGGSRAILRIYGMTLSQMNQLSVAGTVWALRQSRNSVRVDAGDAGAAKSTVFNGFIIEAFPDFTEAPNSAFVISAWATSDLQLKPVPPVSFDGPASAATVFGQIAQNSNLAYEGNGVDAMLNCPYLPGAASAQAAAAAKAAACFSFLDTDGRTLVTVKRDGARRTTSIPVISPSTGMIGYPSYEGYQVILRTLFDPSIRYFGLFRVDTGGLLPPAEGVWRCIDLNYVLSAQQPDGPWECLLKGDSTTAGLAA